VFEAVQKFCLERGFPPSISDVCAIVGTTSQTVYRHLQALHRKGVLDYTPGVSRSWVPTGLAAPRARRVPVVGDIAAGLPILAAENTEGWVTYDDASPSAVLFALRVEGMSMVDVGILNGDLIVVRQQDDADDGRIVVALVDEQEATVKRLFREGPRVRLVAESDEEDQVYDAGQVRVQGVVIAVQRYLEDHPAGGL